jgi:molecular chaperone DnaJ
MPTDYYALLGIPRDADADQIKKAYRKLAMEYHPDRNGGSKEAEARFKEISEAYEVLKDPERRARYDRFGPDGARGAGPGPGGFAGGFDLQDALEMFMRDFGGGGGGGGGFEDLFGGGRRRGRGGPRTQEGETVRVTLPLTLKEVVTGVTRRLRIRLLESCDSCSGTGSADAQPPAPCASCGGSGEERVAQRTVFGQFVSLTTCRSCGGEGSRIQNPCTTCRGEGRTRGEQEIEVEVPPGVSGENYITLRGRGNVGPRGGPRGDVVVLLEVEADPRFLREGDHLIVDVPVTFAQAALGETLEIPGVEAPISLKVPAGIQSGEALRIRGKGVPELNGRGRGDLIVRIRVWTPQPLTAEQRELLEALRQIEGKAPEVGESEAEEEGGGRGFWSRIKEAFTS